MKLVEGCKYDIKIRLHNDADYTEYYGAYFMGVYEIESGSQTTCDCCGKAVMKYPLVFRIPKGNASFDECAILYYTDELVIGSSCAAKAKFKVSAIGQESYVVRAKK